MAMRGQIAAIFLLATLTGLASADDTDTGAPAPDSPIGHGYVGVGGGRVSYTFDSSQCSEEINNLPCTTQTSTNGFKAFVGYNAKTNLSFELTYAHFGALRANVTSPTLNPHFTETVQTIGGNVVLHMPIGSVFSVGARLGVFGEKLTASEQLAANASNGGTNSSGVNLGLHVAATLSRHLGVRLEYENFSSAAENGSDIRLFSGSLLYTF